MSSTDADLTQQKHQHREPSHLKLNECCINDELCNVILKATDGDEINAHKCLLISQSEYFEKMFSGKFLESNQNVVHIKDINNEVMHHLIDFIYTGILVTLDEDNVEEILNGAEILQLNDVRRLCIEFLMLTIDHHNCLQYKEIADSRVISELQKECFEYALIHFEMISIYSNFLDVDITQLTELMQSDDLCIKNEEFLYETIIKWIKHDESERKHLLPQLLSLVRLVFVSRQYLFKKIRREPLVKSSPECLEMIKKVMDHFTYKFGDPLSKLITDAKPRKTTKKITIESSNLPTLECKIPGFSSDDETIIHLTSIWTSTGSNAQNIEWAFLMNENNFLNEWDEEWERVNSPNEDDNYIDNWGLPLRFNNSRFQ